MVEEKLKEEIAKLKEQEDNIRAERHRLESKLFEIFAKKAKQEKGEND